MSREALMQDVAAAKAQLEAAEMAVVKFDSLAENNVFESLDEASSALEEALRALASQDCEGSYNCGSAIYEREFIVDGITYIGKLEVEYNRHDKTYYYIDDAEFSYAPK